MYVELYSLITVSALDVILVHCSFDSNTYIKLANVQRLPAPSVAGVRRHALQSASGTSKKLHLCLLEQFLVIDKLRRLPAEID